MFDLMTKDRLPREVADWDTPIRLQMRRAITARVGRIAETPIGGSKELLRVLIVDDYRASADTMSMLVGAWGHDIRRAYDGTTGLALAAAYQPDVLLLDIIMPGINGLELAQQVRRQLRLNDCLIIAVTGRTDAEQRNQCHKAGVDLFLVKPVDLSKVQTLLTQLSDCRLPTRRAAAEYDVIAKSIRRRRKTNVRSPMRFPCQVRQETVAT